MREGAWQAAFAVSACDLQSIVADCSWQRFPVLPQGSGLGANQVTLRDHNSCLPLPLSVISHLDRAGDSTLLVSQSARITSVLHATA